MKYLKTYESYRKLFPVIYCEYYDKKSSNFTGLHVLFCYVEGETKYDPKELFGFIMRIENDILLSLRYDSVDWESDDSEKFKNWKDFIFFVGEKNVVFLENILKEKEKIFTFIERNIFKCYFEDYDQKCKNPEEIRNHLNELFQLLESEDVQEWIKIKKESNKFNI